MLTVLGEMENSSQILDFMFLGSEWNAANRTELIQNGITHILNITKEIDNFYPGMIFINDKNDRFYGQKLSVKMTNFLLAKRQFPFSFH